MKRSAPPRRKTALKPGRYTLQKPKPKSVRRRRRRAAGRYKRQFGAHASFLRSLSCCCCGDRRNLHVHHVKTRGAGGTWRDTVPLCPSCHAFAHQHGNQALELLWEVDLAADAAMYVRMADERTT